MMIGVGTSGYNYSEWRGGFYPEGFPTSKMLSQTVLEQNSNWQDAFVYFKHELAGKGAEFARIFLDLVR